MSDESKTSIMKTSTERSLTRWTPSIVAILGVAAGFGATWGKVEGHITDKDTHMPYKEKMEVFVPRSEIVSIVTQLNEAIQLTVELSRDSEGRTREDIKRIEDKLDRIENLLLTNEN